MVMKLAAYIFAFMLTIFTVKPGFTDITTAVDISCSVKKGCCKKETPPQSKGCDMPCSPFMGCVNGNFYLHEKPTVIAVPLGEISVELPTYNDNRIIEKSSDCWHPPKVAMFK